MFDVVWANPDRELVGQHKARKERERERRQQQNLQNRTDPLTEDSASSGRSAASLHSDRSSSTKPRSFLDAIRLKRKTSARHDASSLASVSRLSSVFSDTTDTRDARDARDTQGCRTAGPDDDNRRGSLLSPPPSVSSSLDPAGSGSGRHPSFLGDRSFQLTPHFAESLQSSSQDRSSQDDSILSRWTAPTSLATVLSLDQADKNDAADRDLGAEERTRPRMRPVDTARCHTLAPADGDVPGIGQVPPLTPVASSPQKISSPVTPTSPLVFRQASARKAAASSLHSGTAVSDVQLSSHPAFSRPLGRSMSAHSVPAPCTALTRPGGNQPPNVVRAGLPERLASAPVPLPLSRVQRTILQMTAASPETLWERLTEEWRPCANAAQYRKIEMDRKRWLLAALYSINPVPDGGSPDADRRVLAFFESRATTSFLSARHAGALVHHMAPRPLASPLFPNVIPVPAASVPCLSLPAVGPAFVPLSSSLLPQPPLSPLPPLPPLPPPPPSSPPAKKNGIAAAAPVPALASASASASAHTLFSDIYAQALPVLVSSSDIPLVLRNLHRLLRPQGHGVLHLVLIDAAPGPSGFCAGTTGPRMLAWLDKHLLLNLERQFRCTRPTTLFPTWLRDAHFQVASSGHADGGGGGGGETPAGGGDSGGCVSGGGGDGRVVCRFRAVVGEDGEEDGDDTGGPEETPETTTSKQQERAKQRLHSLVGQKLWQEVWGRYVTADRWWWEDEACREECLRLRTTWEYHLVDAVKKERYLVGVP